MTTASPRPFLCPAIGRPDGPISIEEMRFGKTVDVDSAPLSPAPQSPPHLAQLAGENFILMTASDEKGQFCGYRVPGLHAAGGLNPFLNPGEVLQQDGTPRFGAPTSLGISADPHLGVLTWLMSAEGIILTPGFADGNLFVVGGARNLYLYMSAVQDRHQDFTGFIRNFGDEEQVATEKSPVIKISEAEAVQELEAFFNWLQTEDPSAADLLRVTVTFQDFPPEDLPSVPDAMYDPYDDVIILYPSFIASLLIGDYEWARALLAHELAHRHNFVSGRIIPVQEATGRTMDFLTRAVNDGDMTAERAATLAQKYYVRSLDVMPEEELVAYSVMWAALCLNDGPISRRHEEVLMQLYEEYLLRLVKCPIPLALLGLEYAYGTLRSGPDAEIVKPFAELIRYEYNCLSGGFSRCEKSHIQMQEILDRCNRFGLND